MIRSMTGFGAGHGAAGAEALDVEIRSVNHKFCEVKVRLPRELSALEPDVVKLVKERLARGGVDVSARRAGPAGGLAPRVDLALAEAYARAFDELRTRLGLTGAPTLADVAAADGVIRLDEPALDLEAARGALRSGVGDRPRRPGGDAGPGGRGARPRPLRPARARRGPRGAGRGPRAADDRASPGPARRAGAGAVARHPPRRGPPRPGGRALRGSDRRHRGDHAPAQPPRAGARPRRRAASRRAASSTSSSRRCTAR